MIMSPIALISSTSTPPLTFTLVDDEFAGVVVVVVVADTDEDEKACDLYLLSIFRLFVCLVDDVDVVVVAVPDVDLPTVAGDDTEIPETPL